jgi:DMSO/TMAO reductase YedYZ molybdopterin-dependent catalytic subunit
LKDLLDEAGIQTGSNTVIFYAVDGYSSSLPLDYIMNNDIMLAYKMNGVAIPPSE